MYFTTLIASKYVAYFFWLCFAVRVQPDNLLSSYIKMSLVLKFLYKNESGASPGMWDDKLMWYGEKCFNFWCAA